MADLSLFQPSLLVGLLLCLSVMQSHQQASADTQAHSLGASGGWALDGPGEGASHLDWTQTLACKETGETVFPG